MIDSLIRTLRRVLPAALAVLALAAAMGLVGEGLAQTIRKDAFNHVTTGYPLTGSHEQAKCESCHVQGIFKGTHKDCLFCHGPGARVSTVTMPQNHIPVSEKCDTCHNTTKFYGVLYNHSSAVPGSCTVCHNGTTVAPAKPAKHIVTTASCDSCHRINAWLPATFNHANVAPGSCAQCHNGTTATGKSATHLLTTSSCDRCHTTTAWIPGIRFDHAGVLPGTCSQCHDGAHAPGQKPGHPVTSASCDSCHSPVGWLPVRVDHSTVLPGTCSGCHNGANASGKKPNHIPTTDACDKCHKPGAWLPTTFNHQGIAQGACLQCHNGSTAQGQKPGHLTTKDSCDSCHTTAGWLPVAFNHKGVIAGTCGNCHNGQSAAGKTLTHIPVSGNACDACHARTNYVTFAGAPMNHGAVPGVACNTCHELGTNYFSGAVVMRPTLKADPNHPQTGDCGSCHTTSTFGGAGAKPANHIPTTQACALCHTTPGVYTGGVMNHQGITRNCAQCHGPGVSFAGVTPRQPPTGHIPASGIACEGCHSVNNFTTFSNTAMNHAAIPGVACQSCHETGRSWFGVSIVTRPTTATHPKTGDCGTCHNTTSFAVVTTKPANHLPTTQACALCHTVPGVYTGGVMNHQGITGNCAQCHAPGTSFVGVTPPTSPPTHIPVPGVACESCHSKTNFTSFGGTLMNHAGVAGIACQTCHETGRTWFGVDIVTRPVTATHPKTGDCGGSCHNTSSFGGFAKPANHIPTILPCATCHTNLQDFRQYKMSHQGIANNCAQCHGPGLTFATNFVPKAPPANHIPSGNVACESCHAATNFASFGSTPMNHAGTGAIACRSCHETGMAWYGITTVTRPVTATHPRTGDCGACHVTSSFSVVTTKPANHLPTTQACALCHTTPGVYTGGVMNHQGITGNCAQCHAPGTSFVGVTPPTSPPTHIPVAGIACESCHSKTNFTTFGGTLMNHAGVTGIACQSCHETGRTWFGVDIVTRPVTATHPKTGDCGGSCHNTTSFGGFAKPANHIPTILACASCHTNLQDFKQYAMNHQGIANNCAQCHGPGLTFATNFVPKAPPANHIPSGKVACESCHSATNFASFGSTPMNHAGTGAIRCDSCHETGMAWYGITTVTRPTPAADPIHPKPGTGDCGTCHTTTTFKNAVSKPANHIPTTLGCASCHSNAADFRQYTMSHQGIATNCAQCHGPGLVFATNFVPKAPPANHIPSGTVPCESCHSPTKFTNFGGTLMNHAGTGAIRCDSCHETGMAWFGITTVTRPTAAADPNHPKPGTGDCGACHTTTSFATGVAKPANHIPTGQPCTLCHSNPANYKTWTMNHQGISSGCATCHGPSLVFATNVVPKAPPATHIPTNAVACESCHAASNFTTFGGTAMTPQMHTVVAAITCAACHETGKTFFGVTMVTRPTTASHPKTGDCITCHTTTPPFKGDTKPANHIPTTLACALCHTTSDYSKAVMNHQGITNNCALCHGPNLSFANVVPKAPPANHVPYDGLACERCHSPTAFTTFGGTLMKHAGITTSCITCHTDTTSANTAYFGVSIVTTGSKGQHVPLTYGVSNCATCHIAPYDPPTATFLNGITSRTTVFHDHATVPKGGCLPCHQTPQQIKPTGPEKLSTKSSGHEGGKSCDSSGCHNTTTFNKSATLGQGGAAAASASSARAPDTSALRAPGAGDTSAAWPGPNALRAAVPGSADLARPAGAQPANANPHAGILPNGCLACHNGSAASGKPGRHLLTFLSCDSCHRTTTWIPASFRHDLVVPGQCATCHNSAGAKAKPANHVVTTMSCDSCHRTSAWFPLVPNAGGPAGPRLQGTKPFLVPGGK